jgi:hypothetical protein
MASGKLLGLWNHETTVKFINECDFSFPVHQIDQRPESINARPMYCARLLELSRSVSGRSDRDREKEK